MIVEFGWIVSASENCHVFSTTDIYQDSNSYDFHEFLGKVFFHLRFSFML
jgi:hypothetical protein